MGEHRRMTDGPGRRMIKAAVRVIYLFELSIRRRITRALGRDLYRLAGTCQRCAKCCERPTLALPSLLYRARPLRRLVLLWQWHINRFAFVAGDDDARTLQFRCAHFDPATRHCDSYESRPAMCRDYPRFLLDQAWPDLFEECGFRAVSRNADSLSRAINQTALSPEERERLKRKLHILG